MLGKILQSFFPKLEEKSKNSYAQMIQISTPGIQVQKYPWFWDKAL